MNRWTKGGREEGITVRSFSFQQLSLKSRKLKDDFQMYLQREEVLNHSCVNLGSNHRKQFLAPWCSSPVTTFPFDLVIVDPRSTFASKRAALYFSLKLSDRERKTARRGIGFTALFTARSADGAVVCLRCCNLMGEVATTEFRVN